MPAIDPFVAKDAADLVDALEPADDQALEVQLEGDAQLEIEIESVVMRRERTRGRPSRLLRLVQDGGLHFDEIQVLEEAADTGDELRAAEEDLAHLQVRAQIHVALPVPSLVVGETVPFFRERAQRLRQQAVLGRLDGELAGLRAHGAATGENDVSQIGELEDLVRLVADLVLLDEDLQVAGAVAKAEEGRLAHGAQRHHPSGDAIGLALVLFQLGCVVVGVADAHEPRGVRDDDAVAIRLDPLLPKEVGLLLSQADLIFDRAGRSSLGSVGHGVRLFTLLRPALSPETPSAQNPSMRGE